MTREVIHIHNATLKLIDKKMSILVETMDYLHENSFNQVSLKRDVDKAFSQLQELKKTKDFLLEHSGFSEVDYIKVGIKGYKGKRPVGLIDGDGVLIKEFESLAEAERDTDVNRSTISYMIKNPKKNKGIYNFKFL
jgi:hypothetical protein